MDHLTSWKRLLAAAGCCYSVFNAHIHIMNMIIVVIIIYRDVILLKSEISLKWWYCLRWTCASTASHLQTRKQGKTRSINVEQSSVSAQKFVRMPELTDIINQRFKCFSLLFFFFFGGGSVAKCCNSTRLVCMFFFSFFFSSFRLNPFWLITCKTRKNARKW